LKTAGGLLFVTLVAYMTRSRHRPIDLLHFVVPPAALVSLLVLLEWRDGRGSFGERMRGLARLVLPFLSGVALPLAAFLGFYWRIGALRELVEGVVVRPSRQLVIGTMPFIEPATILVVVPYAALLAFPWLLARLDRRRAFLGLAAVLAVLLWLSRNYTVYTLVWMWARSMDFVAVLAGALVLASRRDRPSGERDDLLFLAIALAACLGLIQFPFSAPIYGLYALPFTILALAFVVTASRGSEPVRWAHAQVLVFAIGFAVLVLNPGAQWWLGRAPGRLETGGRLTPPRGAIRVPRADADVYNELVALVREKAGASPIYAGPEAPEVYFLCGKPNPTRILFEFVSGVSPGRDTARLSHVFEEPELKVIVWNRHPGFTKGLWDVYKDELHRRFPHSREVGKFTVMWRDGAV
jgi:hypothetical protein